MRRYESSGGGGGGGRERGEEAEVRGGCPIRKDRSSQLS